MGTRYQVQHHLRLSEHFIATFMLALQKTISDAASGREVTPITELLEGFDCMVDGDGEIFVTNPPQAFGYEDRGDDEDEDE